MKEKFADDLTKSKSSQTAHPVAASENIPAPARVRKTIVVPKASPKASPLGGGRTGRRRVNKLL